MAARGTTTAAIAGGQSLLPMLNLRVALPDLLVDIGRTGGAQGTVTKPPDSLRIGALTTHAAIEDGKVPDMFGGLMQQVASGRFPIAQSATTARSAAASRLPILPPIGRSA